jgi:ferredoxin
VRLRADTEKCQAHGVCAMVDPDMFPLTEEGFTAIGQDEPISVTDESLARTGVSMCPVRALEITDEAGGEVD